MEPPSPEAFPRSDKTANPRNCAELNKLFHSLDRVVRHTGGDTIYRIVDSVLRADGWVTKTFEDRFGVADKRIPGPDGRLTPVYSSMDLDDVEIFAGRGRLGLQPPYLYVLVKPDSAVASENAYKSMLESMQYHNAELGLLVCWGGFSTDTQAVARKRHFQVRLWDSRDLVEAIYTSYEHLPTNIQSAISF